MTSSHKPVFCLTFISICTVIQLANRQALLGVLSVRNKFAKTRAVAQDDRQSVAGKIVLALFPEVFASAARDASAYPDGTAVTKEAAFEK